MRENKFRKWIRTEIETEAEALEKKAEENTELSSLHMPEDSFADLMSRIEAEKKNAAENSSAIRPFHIRRRTLVAVALAAVLLAALGLGASGERLFAPTVESEIADGEYNVTIISGDEEIYMDVTEEEAYDEIEDRLGILALRLGYKPKGMELTKVTIGEDMGEAQMEFYYESVILKIYENKQHERAVFETQTDGQIIDSVEMFQYDKEINILQMNGNDSELLAVQLENSNAYYYVTSNLDIEEFKRIVQGIFFEVM
ncbi:DUF4367 domain-containing protein [Lachnoclostridium sp. An138]|uniref:DUF4367 domain-containing protein n=1 Tax=Lachnoclostridium sp. An138 TaxID=1965560 RepID=UPI000B381496|nr:DUF4367 domain-containing protein [Lachnoclostridium sp. An138]OUQ15530.1 hypothetical protein B5E82_15645 [Lachnoclostridium sp. An138]